MSAIPSSNSLNTLCVTSLLTDQSRLVINESDKSFSVILSADNPAAGYTTSLRKVAAGLNEFLDTLSEEASRKLTKSQALTVVYNVTFFADKLLEHNGTLPDPNCCLKRIMRICSCCTFDALPIPAIKDNRLSTFKGFTGLKSHKMTLQDVSELLQCFAQPYSPFLKAIRWLAAEVLGEDSLKHYLKFSPDDCSNWLKVAAALDKDEGQTSMALRNLHLADGVFPELIQSERFVPLFNALILHLQANPELVSKVASITSKLFVAISRETLSPEYRLEAFNFTLLKAFHFFTSRLIQAGPLKQEVHALFRSSCISLGIIDWISRQTPEADLKYQREIKEDSEKFTLKELDKLLDEPLSNGMSFATLLSTMLNLKLANEESRLMSVYTEQYWVIADRLFKSTLTHPQTGKLDQSRVSRWDPLLQPSPHRIIFLLHACLQKNHPLGHARPTALESRIIASSRLLKLSVDEQVLVDKLPRNIPTRSRSTIVRTSESNRPAFSLALGETLSGLLPLDHVVEINIPGQVS